MKHLPDVTLCAIDTRTPELALQALRRSSEGLRFGRTLLLGDRVPAGLAAPEEFVPIEPLRSGADYSTFVLKRLVEHVRTPHVLIVQWDGFVIHPACWSDEFLAWDYLGAPWGDGPQGRLVGNGGFTLRSRRLLQALRDDDALQLHHPEDTAICHTNAERLEQHWGIRFAPLALAQRFAFENLLPAQPTLGFHGSYNVPYFMDEAQLRTWFAALPDELLAGRDGWKTVKRLLRCRQPALAREVLARHRRGGQAALKAHAMALRLALWGR